MYGKEEAYELRKLFWTSFGKFMKRHKSADFSKVNWMNYKTGAKDLYFRLEADKRTAKICIDLQMEDSGIRRCSPVHSLRRIHPESENKNNPAANSQSSDLSSTAEQLTEYWQGRRARQPHTDQPSSFQYRKYRPG